MHQEKVFSMLKGYTFKFEDEGKKIKAWFSALSGLEKIYVDDALVSSQRNFSTNSSNGFKVGAHEYTTNLKVDNLFKGPFVCTLIKNGKEYKRQKLVFPSPKIVWRKIIGLMFMYLAFAAFFVFAYSYWQLPKEAGYVYFVAVFLFMFYFSSKYSKRTFPEIVDEDIN